jgi:hypothetical protein
MGKVENVNTGEHKKWEHQNRNIEKSLKSGELGKNGNIQLKSKNSSLLQYLKTSHIIHQNQSQPLKRYLIYYMISSCIFAVS